MPKFQRYVAVLATLGAAAFMAGCGGSSDSGVSVNLPVESPTTMLRTLAPEQSGPAATITPAPLASPRQVSPSSAVSPSAASSGSATSSRPAVPKPKKSKKAQQPSSNCDPNYSGACVPIVGFDLDCPDVGASVTVEGTDIHGFDADGDGAGCESY